MYALGADYSVWQDDNSTAQTVNFWKARSAGLSFAGIKASQGTFADPDFIINWNNARGNVYRMPYHFLVWDQPPADQANFFWGLLKNDPGELPLIVDFEWWKTTPPTAIGMLRVFLNTMRGLTGRDLGIYTAKSFWDVSGSKDPWFAQFALWLCDISGPVEIPQPWTKWDFWQYTFKMYGPTFGAESLDLDGDKYNGSEEDMRRRWNLPELPSTTTYNGIRMQAIRPVNIRTAPTTTAPIVGALKAGDIVVVTDADGNDVWVKHDLGWSCKRQGSTRYLEI